MSDFDASWNEEIESEAAEDVAKATDDTIPKGLYAVKGRELTARKPFDWSPHTKPHASIQFNMRGEDEDGEEINRVRSFSFNHEPAYRTTKDKRPTNTRTEEYLNWCRLAEGVAKANGYKRVSEYLTQVTPKDVYEYVMAHPMKMYITRTEKRQPDEDGEWIGTGKYQNKMVEVRPGE